MFLADLVGAYFIKTNDGDQQIYLPPSSPIPNVTDAKYWAPGMKWEVDVRVAISTRIIRKMVDGNAKTVLNIGEVCVEPCVIH